MGAGRKTKTFPAKEKSKPNWTVNCSAVARNITKNELGAVIFGCKHHTIQECLQNLLFGLPENHFSYVKRITPGLPLFLFNYSDRKLHGIFEAVSLGEMYINPHAWIYGEDAEFTPYGAQVRVRVLRRCRPLREEEFKPIIAYNYYEEKLFWFELDKRQAGRLTKLFSASPLMEKTPRQPIVARSNMFDALPSSDVDDAAVESNNLELEGLSASSDQFILKQDSWQCSSSTTEMNLKESHEHSYASILVKKNASVEPRQAIVARSNNMFDALPSSDVDDAAVASNNLELEGLSANSDQFILKQDSWQCSSSTTEMNLKEGHEHSYASILVKKNASVEPQWCQQFQSSSHSHGSEKGGISMIENLAHLSIADDVKGSEGSDELNVECVSSPPNEWEDHISIENEVRKSEACLDVPNTEYVASFSENLGDHVCTHNDVKEMYDNILVNCIEDNERDGYQCDSIDVQSLGDSSIAAKAPGETIMGEDATLRYMIPVTNAENYDRGHNQPNLTDGAISENNNTISDVLLMEVHYSKYHSVLSKLMEEIGELKLSQSKQGQQINSLENELDNSKMEIHHLKERCNILESGPSSRRNYCEKEGCEHMNSKVDESVFIVGGFDGNSWLPALSSYSPSKDVVKSLFSMTTVRSYASAAKLNGEIYVLGGVYDDVWYDTVESYNPTSGRCMPRPSLNRKKGSLAGASLCGKIFAIGGGDGKECFSEVEELDLNTGRWILTNPMLERRFAPGAVDMNGKLYVTGGFDGKYYLRSVERFDPRERSWTRLGSMNAKRGCHSLVAYNEKLYALGGYDGTVMVPTVEVFDPRVGLWMIEEPMKKSRGYFGSVVLGRKIYVIGGIDDRGAVLDAIEYYEEGRGWQVAELGALGKRSFFSALAL